MHCLQAVSSVYMLLLLLMMMMMMMGMMTMMGSACKPRLLSMVLMMLTMIMMRRDCKPCLLSMMMMIMMMRRIMMRHDEDDEERDACFESYLRLLSSGTAKPTSMPRSQHTQKCVFTARATRNVISQHAPGTP